MIDFSTDELETLAIWGRCAWDAGSVSKKEMELLAKIREEIGMPNDETYQDARYFDSNTTVFCHKCGKEGPIGVHEGHKNQRGDGSWLITYLPKHEYFRND